MRAFFAGVAVALLLALPVTVRSVDVPGRAQAFRALQSSVSLVLPFRDKDGKIIGEQAGCAGVIAAKRLVLTAFHCVRGPGENGKLFVRPYADQKQLLATQLAWHRVGIDLAVLETPTDIPGKIAELAPDVAVGESVVAIGAPDGEEFLVTKGIISKIVVDYFENCGENDPLGREAHHVLLADMMLFFGNSGGGLFNDFGQLVGISERVAVASGECGVPYAGQHIVWGYFVGLDTLRSFFMEKR